jgi:CTP:molybdopterin cytidylyltransferase MocA
MDSDYSGPRLTALVLAGDRSPSDPLAQASVAGCKALLEIEGTPMVRRVLTSLQQASLVDHIRLTGPHEAQLASDSELSEWIAASDIQWSPPGASPSSSAAEVMRKIDVDLPVLLTTCDHPMLTATMVDAFARQGLHKEADVVICLAPYALVREAYPTMKKTVLRFSDGEFCSCNLFIFNTLEGRGVADFWRRIEQQRKKPLRIIRLLGWRAVLRYRLGLLSLEEALHRLGKRLGLRIEQVVVPYADAAIDVDSLDDLHQVRARLEGAPAAS